MTRTDTVDITATRLDAVSVMAARPSAMGATEVLGDIELGLSTISRLPGLAGSADPMRTLQLMPGIQTTGEVSGGLYVRGSTNAHNLVELNGARIYNSSHLLGIFSVFNDGNLSSFSLHKSYIPPRYGGGLGGVVSAGTLTSPPRRLSASGEVGLIASRLTLGVPTGGASGLYLSGRATYVDPILRMVSGSSKKHEDMRLGYNMYDLGLTFVGEPSDRDRVTANLYHGADRLSIGGIYDSGGGIDWGNSAGSVVWEHSFAKRHKLSQTVWASRYDNGIEADHGSVSLSMPSSITDVGYKALVESRRDGISWEWGLDYTLHIVGLQYPVFSGYFLTGSGAPAVTTHEAGLFAEAVWQISPTVDLRGGLRASMLVHTREKIYASPEPRLNLTVRTGALSAVSVSAGIQQQYMNQVTASNTGFPTDFWMPTSSLVPPQRGYSLSAGYRRRTRDRVWEFSAELYYKALTGQMESRKGMIGNFNSAYDIYEGIEYGRGRNFGLELLVDKKYGRLSGWLSYTLGWALRSFPGIEGGRWFSMAYERRHDLSLTAIYKISDRWSVSSSFVFATGNAYTPVLGVYMMGEVAVNEYGPHNSARMPPYHRMDVAAVWDIPSVRGRDSGAAGRASASRAAGRAAGRRSWDPGRLTFSVYNLYARKNPIAFYAYLNMGDSESAAGTVTLQRRPSALYSIIPSVSYSFDF
ncbi:MAG: TonB-dependent receptor plug domain-containing protein [Alistipes sp.]|nr:TonB-dependent receptor plug domain-containing protein [Alistipes sp.]